MKAKICKTTVDNNNTNMRLYFIPKMYTFRDETVF